MLFHGSRLVIHPEFEGLFKAAGMKRPEDVIAAWIPEPPRPDRRSRVAELRLPRGGSVEHVFLKTYDYAWPDRLRTFAIPARARREYENLEGLLRLGLPVPHPVAWGQTRRLGFVASSFVMTRAIEGAIDLRDLAAGAAPPFPAPDRPGRRDLITTFARRLRRCHDQGWFLHTAFFKNLLLTHAGGTYDLHVIDVPFARIWRNRLRPAAGRRRDFATLQKGAVKLLTPGERFRFFRAYRADEGPLTRADKAFLRAVDAASRAL